MNWIDVTTRLPEMLPRDKKDGTRLISAWVEAQIEDGTIIDAYYHFHHGWMKRGEVEGDCIFGYVPTNGIKKWRKL